MYELYRIQKLNNSHIKKSLNLINKYRNISFKDEKLFKKKKIFINSILFLFVFYYDFVAFFFCSIWMVKCYDDACPLDRFHMIFYTSLDLSV